MTTLTDAYGRTIAVARDDAGDDVYALDGISVAFPAETPQAQALAAIEGMAPADYAPPAAPASSPALTFLEFVALFTPAEQAAIASSTDGQVKLFVMKATGSGGLALDNAEVVAGVNYLSAVGVIAPARAAAILAGQSPT